jgi:hypothetical protein
VTGPEVEVVDADARRLATYPSFDPVPRIGETIVVDDPVGDRYGPLRAEGEVVDVRHYPSERLVVVEVDVVDDD